MWARQRPDNAFTHTRAQPLPALSGAFLLFPHSLRFAPRMAPKGGRGSPPRPRRSAVLRSWATPLKGGLGHPRARCASLAGGPPQGGPRVALSFFLFSAREIDPLKAGSYYGDPLWGSPVGGGPKNLTPPLGVADRRGAKGKPTPTEEPAFFVRLAASTKAHSPPAPTRGTLPLK